MVAVEATCRTCGEKFLHGVFPESECEKCQMARPSKAYMQIDSKQHKRRKINRQDDD